LNAVVLLAVSISMGQWCCPIKLGKLERILRCLKLPIVWLKLWIVYGVMC